MHYYVNTTLSTIPVSYGILNPWKIYPGFNIPYSILDENLPRGQYTMGFKIPYDTGMSLVPTADTEGIQILLFLSLDFKTLVFY